MLVAMVVLVLGLEEDEGSVAVFVNQVGASVTVMVVVLAMLVVVSIWWSCLCWWKARDCGGHLPRHCVGDLSQSVGCRRAFALHVRSTASATFLLLLFLSSLPPLSLPLPIILTPSISARVRFSVCACFYYGCTSRRQFSPHDAKTRRHRGCGARRRLLCTDVRLASHPFKTCPLHLPASPVGAPSAAPAAPAAAKPAAAPAASAPKPKAKSSFPPHQVWRWCPLCLREALELPRGPIVMVGLPRGTIVVPEFFLARTQAHTPIYAIMLDPVYATCPIDSTVELSRCLAIPAPTANAATRISHCLVLPCP